MPRRKLRPGSSSRPTLAALRHVRTPEHLQACAECRAALHRERQYLERLRGSAVPEASQDLAARLIQHTERLANQPEFSGAAAPNRSGALRSLRIAGIAAGTLAVSAGALAVSAYVVAGDTEEPAFASSSDAGLLAGALKGGPAELMASPDFRQNGTVTLSGAQLASLREQGWACPELAGLGFSVVSARATLHNGHPAVELNLESNGHYATVVEEHLQAVEDASGRTAPARLSVTQGKPWEAVYATPGAVISYTSDLPADVADDAVPEIVRAGDSMSLSTSVQGSESWYERLLRGLRTLLRPAGL
ncbi:hypothetical protein ACFRJ9_22185 [Paenarthrobacter sp. NPDC056912]|uniref:hypothetical protein n=1 Tax=Paenarthrobacter sp. NPDC056912 TaxID=3345965 RepID=UPI00366BB128